MRGSVADRLNKLGLDVDFLVWLEGAQDRLTHVDQLAKVSDASLAAAVRTAVWLTSQFADPKVVSLDKSEDWKGRYELLEAFLWNALRHTMFFHRVDRPKDLEALEELLGLLLPPSKTIRFREDLQHLRALGKPERLLELASGTKKPRRGGRKQSEQVQRMRAAVEDLRSKSKRPYRDLAQLWNEALGESRYDPDQIRQNLRRGEQAGRALLAFWKDLYQGEGYRVFPGPFP